MLRLGDEPRFKFDGTKKITEIDSSSNNMALFPLEVLAGLSNSPYSTLSKSAIDITNASIAMHILGASNPSESWSLEYALSTSEILTPPTPSPLLSFSPSPVSSSNTTASIFQEDLPFDEADFQLLAFSNVNVNVNDESIACM